MSDFTDYHILDVEIIRETDKAVLIHVEGFGENVWIPKSQIDDRSEIWHAGESGKLWISDWIAQEKGLA